MIKDESKIREKDWRKSKEKWTEQCRGVKTWGEAEKLFSTWDDNAVDWRKVSTEGGRGRRQRARGPEDGRSCKEGGW